MIYQSMIRRAEELSNAALFALPGAAQWNADLPARRAAFRRMLALPPTDGAGDMHVTHTGLLERDDYLVEKCHFQPVAGARVAANIYRPRTIDAPLPAVVYVCGHAARGKFYYQNHARWFGRHGYVCMVIDPFWAGECGGFHHGVYDKSWWHWFSQGYTPAGMETWAAIRAADYLQGRDDVDGARLGVTGNSGGGSTSWFAAAADERFKAAAPSCQTGNALQHIKDRTVDTHCDCTWWINTLGWDHTDVAALIAPRPLLVAAQTEDIHFRPFAYRDLVYRVGRLYRLLGAPEKIRLAEDGGQHGYTPATRLAIFNWFERHLKGSNAVVTEDVDPHDNSDDDLAVYPDRRPPADDRMAEVHTFFAPIARRPEIVDRPRWEKHQAEALAALKATSFRQTRAGGPVEHVEMRPQGSHERWAFKSFDFDTEPGLRIRAHYACPLTEPTPSRLILGPVAPDARTPCSGAGAGLRGVDPARTAFGTVEVRGTGRTSIGPGLEWTIRRAYPLLGQTLPERRVFDLLGGAAVVAGCAKPEKTALFGAGAAAPLSIYAALLNERIDALVLQAPRLTHWDGGPEFLSILQVGDVVENLALLWPRPILFVGGVPNACRYVADVYAACGAPERVAAIDEISDWVDHV